MKRPTLISFCLLSLFASLLYGQQPRAGAISFEPYSLKTYDQQEHPAELYFGGARHRCDESRSDSRNPKVITGAEEICAWCVANRKNGVYY